MTPKTEKVHFALGVLMMAILHSIGTFLLVFVAGFGSKILTFPFSLMDTPQNPISSWLGGPMLIATSLLWGYAICALLRRLRNRQV